MTGPTLKELREKRGWTQQQLADALNVALDRRYTSATVSQWELDKRSVPSHVASFLEQLAIHDVLPPDPSAPPAAEDPSPPREAPQDAPPGGPGPLPPPQPAITPTGAYSRLCAELWEMLGTGIGILGAGVGNQALIRDGQIIASDKDALGRAWGKLAETNETFRRMLTGATSSGAWLEIALVTGGTVTKVWANHQEQGGGARVLGPSGEPLDGHAVAAVA